MNVSVTQVQQILSVDIMFVYRMPILRGLLALVQVHDLRDDHEVASVTEGMKRFISTAKKGECSTYSAFEQMGKVQSAHSSRTSSVPTV